MRRANKHKANLNRIIQDTRLMPNRRLFAQFLACWLDATSDDERKVLTSVLLAQYGLPQRITVNDPDDEVQKETNTNQDKEQREHLKQALKDILGEENDSTS